MYDKDDINLWLVQFEGIVTNKIVNIFKITPPTPWVDNSPSPINSDV